MIGISVAEVDYFSKSSEKSSDEFVAKISSGLLNSMSKFDFLTYFKKYVLGAVAGTVFLSNLFVFACLVDLYKITVLGWDPHKLFVFFLFCCGLLSLYLFFGLPFIISNNDDYETFKRNALLIVNQTSPLIVFPYKIPRAILKRIGEGVNMCMPERWHKKKGQVSL